MAGLDDDERARLRGLSEAFLAEKQFSPAGDLQLTDECCLSITLQACLLILNLGLPAYRGWLEIVVYPHEFVVPRTEVDESGVVHEYRDRASGEAWEGGPLLISWDDVQMSGDGYNVVIHEFAHKLDMQNGEVDGIPELHSGIGVDEWRRILQDAYADFCNRVELGTADQAGFDPYASEDQGEFFAVMSETYFEAPELLFSSYPEFYRLLCRYYKQNPLERRLALKSGC